MQITPILVGGVVGYLFAVARDRKSMIRSRKIEAIDSLHNRVLQIEKKELSDGKAFRLAVGIEGGSEPRTGSLSDWEVQYQSKLGVWRRELREEENRASLWIDQRTVRLVGAYFFAHDAVQQLGTIWERKSVGGSRFCLSAEGYIWWHKKSAKESG